MIDTLTLAIGIGLVVSLVFSELLGLAAGGMVVPGYVALHLHDPVSVALTLGAAVITFAVVRTLSSSTIIFGRRRTVLMILIGYMAGALMAQLPGALSAGAGSVQTLDYATIGYIIPGLIAIWIDRQGLLETVSSLLTASVVVRLVLILVLGSELELAS